MKKHLLCLGLILSSNAFAKNLIIPDFMFQGSDVNQEFIKNAKGDESFIEDLESPSETFYWQHLSPNEGYQGVQADRVYEEMKLNHSQEIIVAVIDSGVDIYHEDLQGKLWINVGEIPGNGIDDDQNGYIDDVNGWNFIGGADGKNIGADSLEVAREVSRLKKLKQERISQGYDLSPAEQALYNEVQKVVSDNLNEGNKNLTEYKTALEKYEPAEDIILARTHIEEISSEALEQLISIDDEVNAARDLLLELIEDYGLKSRINAVISYYSDVVNYYYNPEFDPRAEIVGDDYLNPADRFYGNNDVKGPDSSHGTHVSGIIAANRDNEMGMKGIASNVKIMAIRAVPNGDERDKDVANSIIYAVDNGAQIINMSFGKGYSPYKGLVDQAVAYAASKGVLLIHAAGNDSHNNDLGQNYPTDISVGGIHFPNWIEVGASTWDSGSLVVAPFSNYGKKQIDIFAPGFQIYSTTPENTYAKYNGTSMAAPTVSGVAALVASQHKSLVGNSRALRELLVQSSRRLPLAEVVQPTDAINRFSRTYVKILENNLNPFEVFAEKKVKPKIGFLSEISVSGGIADAYSALSVLALEN
jgi:cell wall-associated protease